MTDPTVHTCARCGRPMRHDTALIDAPCANLLRRHLEDVAKIAGDITLTVARLDEVERGHGQPDDLGWWRAADDIDLTRRPATNLAARTVTDRSALVAIATPPRLDAAERHDAAVGELGTWARHVAETRGQQVEPIRRWQPSCSHGRCQRVHAAREIGTTCPLVLADHPLETAATYLASNLEWLRHRPEADEAWPALLAACGELVRVIDTRLPGELVGMCACGTARYSTEGVCPRCRAEDLAYNRADLDAGRDDLLVTATEAARYVADCGLISGTKGSTDRLRKLIWAWADRGHITAVDDIPRYRLGDVLDRVMASPALLRAA